MKKRRDFTMMVLFVGTIGVLCVWMRLDILRVGYEIERLEEQKREALRQEESLQVRLSKLTAPQEIARAARSRLRLRSAKAGQIVMVMSDTAAPSDRDDAAPNEMQVAFNRSKRHE